MVTEFAHMLKIRGKRKKKRTFNFTFKKKKRKDAKSLYFWVHFVARIGLVGQHLVHVPHRTALLHWVDNLYYSVADHSLGLEEPTKSLVSHSFEVVKIAMTPLTVEDLIPTATCCCCCWFTKCGRSVG